MKTPSPYSRKHYFIHAVTLLFSVSFLVPITLAQEAGKPAALENRVEKKVDSHVGDCVQKEGINKTRCERHETMATKCGAIKGDAHFQCDRDYLLANPLDCSKQNGKDGEQCKAEVAAFKTCEVNQGREFMKCVRSATGVSPMGH